MKILYVIPALTVGGAEKLVVDILPILKNKGHEVSLLTLKKNDGFFLDILLQKGISIHSLNMDDIYSFRLIFKIKKYLKEYDIVHVHLFPSLYWVALSKCFYRLNRVKLFYTEHSTNNKRRDKKYFRYIEKFIYKKYDKVISITEEVQESLCKWIKVSVSDNRFIVVENGIELDLFKNADKYNYAELSLPDSANILFMAGRFSQPKDQGTIIKALKILDNKDVFLLLAGDGELRAKNEKLAYDLGIENQVRFLGLRNDIPQLIKTSDICILSSNWEGLPLGLIEYMAAKRPVIGADVRGINNLIRNVGILFEYGNASDLAQKIQFLLNNKKDYDVIVERGVKKSDLYNIENTVNKYIDEYKNIYSY